MALLTLDCIRRPLIRAGGTLTIVPVNNMPDAALKTTERQFREPAGECVARLFTLRVFSSPGMHRSADGRRCVAEHYAPLANFGERGPRSSSGAAPIAQGSKTSHVGRHWPVLANRPSGGRARRSGRVQHAAMHHIDVVERPALVPEAVGRFRVRQGRRPPLLSHRRHAERPHTRLQQRAARNCASRHGYGHVVTVARRWRRRFYKALWQPSVFLQAVRRKCRGARPGMPARCCPVSAGKSDTYPELPANYFPAEVAAATQTVSEMVWRDRDTALLERRPALSAPWQEAAVKLYSGRFAHLAGGGRGWRFPFASGRVAHGSRPRPSASPRSR
jgi:homoserine O-succinyltransferase/O-acetyltransferase